MLSKGSFERAVKNFRRRQASFPPPHISRAHPESPALASDAYPDRHYTREHAKHDLQGFPAELLTHAKTFHKHIYYFLTSLNRNEPPPQTLRKLLDEIVESEHMDARLKREMIGDDNGRKVVSYMRFCAFVIDPLC